MDPSIIIRREKNNDIAGIRRVNELAFEQPGEADIVDALRSAGAAILSLVAERNGTIIGHILFSPVTIDTEAGPFEAVGLAPLAVFPGTQRTGIGSMLVRAGLDELRRVGHGAVIVLGHAEYYPRFGFAPASRWGIRWELDAPDEAFMAMELRPGALSGCGGVVRFRPEFSGV